MASCLKRLFFPSTVCTQASGKRFCCTAKGPTCPEKPGITESKEEPSKESGVSEDQCCSVDRQQEHSQEPSENECMKHSDNESEVCAAQDSFVVCQSVCPEEENECEEQIKAESKIFENRDYRECLIVKGPVSPEMQNGNEEQNKLESQTLDDRDCLAHRGPVCPDESDESEEEICAESKVFEIGDYLVVRGPVCPDKSDESEEQISEDPKMFENRDYRECLIVKGPVSPEMLDENEEQINAESKVFGNTGCRDYVIDKAVCEEQPSTALEDVPCLSSAVFQLSSEEVGPGASKDGEYKNPEYYSYNRTSYYDAHLEMLKYRQPQPSNRSR